MQSLNYNRLKQEETCQLQINHIVILSLLASYSCSIDVDFSLMHEIKKIANLTS